MRGWVDIDAASTSTVVFMEWSIQQIARLGGVTSRTLRHYGSVGILPPSRVAANGYRYYDQASLVRLQRILLLRQLGVGIPAIRQSLEGADPVSALSVHLSWLRQERERLDRQIQSVEHTVRAVEKGSAMNAHDALDGFDQARFEQEVTERWGAKAWSDGQRWWKQMSDADRQRFKTEQQQIQRDYGAAQQAGLAAESDDVQHITARHYAWVGQSWQDRAPDPQYFANLGEMYVADERFAANYGGVEGATFVRDAMRVFADRASERRR